MDITLRLVILCCIGLFTLAQGFTPVLSGSSECARNVKNDGRTHYCMLYVSTGIDSSDYNKIMGYSHRILYIHNSNTGIAKAYGLRGIVVTGSWESPDYNCKRGQVCYGADNAEYLGSSATDVTTLTIKTSGFLAKTSADYGGGQCICYADAMCDAMPDCDAPSFIWSLAMC